MLAKKFAEAVKKAKETPMGERPLRDFDLDSSRMSQENKSEEIAKFQLPQIVLPLSGLATHFITS